MMIRRRTGYRAHGQVTRVRGTRLSLELDGRVQAVALGLGVTVSQVIADATLLGVSRLEAQHGIGPADCGVADDTEDGGDADTEDSAEDNHEEEE